MFSFRGAKRRRTAKQKQAEDLAEEQERADVQNKLTKIQKLTEDLQKAEDAARENVEAAVVLSTMQAKGIINIDQAFNVTLNQTGESMNQS